MQTKNIIIKCWQYLWSKWWFFIPMSFIICTFIALIIGIIFNPNLESIGKYGGILWIIQLAKRFIFDKIINY